METSHTYKAQIEELTKRFDSTEIRILLRQMTLNIQHALKKSVDANTELSESIKLLERKNKQLESEIDQLKMQLGRIEEQYNKRHNERLKLAKRIIEFEQRNEDIEGQICDIEAKIKERESGIRRLSQPSGEVLFREIMKGFNVEFIQRDTKLLVRLHDGQKSNVIEIFTTGKSAADISNEIWNNML